MRACRGAGLAVEVVPGPSAVLAALVLSGFPTDRFVFEGFLPRKGAERRARLEAIAGDERTVVVFEAPNRVMATLDDLLAVCDGDRLVCVGDIPGAGIRRRADVDRPNAKRWEQGLERRAPPRHGSAPLAPSSRSSRWSMSSPRSGLTATGVGAVQSIGQRRGSR